jgi:branched-chain amino acid transport system permease protein
MNSTSSIIGILGFFLLLVFVPWWAGGYITSVFLSLALWIALTQSWVVLSGFTGYLSLGHAVFFGIGSYVGVLVWGSVPLWLAMVIGAAAAGLFAAAIGYPALRVRGPYFAMLTFGLAELVKYLVIYIEAALGEFGRIIVGGPPLTEIYYLMLTLAAAATCLTYLIAESRTGFALRAIRENEEAAETAGIAVAYYKLGAFTISAIVPAMAGVLMVMRSTYFEPITAFDPAVSFMVVTMAIIGGSDDARGPFVGAIFLTVLSEFLLSSAPQIYMIILGALLIVFVLLLPRGLVGLVVGGERLSTQ